MLASRRGAMQLTSTGELESIGLHTCARIVPFHACHDVCKRYLFICRLVNTGNTPVENYNNSQPAQLQIRNGDYIKAVNGESNNAESMSEAMKKSATLDITIVRPFTFTQTISKNGLSLGLDLKYGPGGASLLVEGVREGVVQKIAADVRGGDRIISVNGVVGTPYVLMQCIQENQHLELGMSRPSS
mmetsp:Transcript_103455/g.333320  ORF Transcript_103455/g.333320 Transcript_103455/m.333320 type:complete len:187 (+) Transcript_103455:137-697(+)